MVFRNVPNTFQNAVLSAFALSVSTNDSLPFALTVLPIYHAPVAHAPPCVSLRRLLRLPLRSPSLPLVSLGAGP